MIGNDIVDLNVASIESNWQRKGFLSKIFTADEQELILNVKDSFKMVWLLWSMKESAYKVYEQQYGKRFFAPKKIQCELITESRGTVLINEEVYSTKSTINNDYISTIAILKSNDNILSANFELADGSYKAQHFESYRKLKLEISLENNCSVKEINIKKNNIGVPKLFLNNKKLSTSFSISHHGNYGSYSILN
jgi:phosphopantetheinyl transferase (holo-ACP synthase)